MCCQQYFGSCYVPGTGISPGMHCVLKGMRSFPPGMWNVTCSGSDLTPKPRLLLSHRRARDEGAGSLWGKAFHGSERTSDQCVLGELQTEKLLDMITYD